MKKQTKRPAKKAAKKAEYKNVLCHPATWIVSACVLAFMIIVATLLYGVVRSDSSYTVIDNGKLAVFDGIATEFLEDYEINSERPTNKVITGYGISDENDTFYITFNFSYADDETNTPHAAIMYIYSPEQTKNSGNGYAFGYYDDNPTYRPSGAYEPVATE